MDEITKKIIDELYGNSYSTGKELMSVLEKLSRLKEKKEQMPAELSEVVDKLSNNFNEAFRMHFEMHNRLINTGAVQEPKYYIKQPVKKENGNIEEYKKSKIRDSICKAGIQDKELADQLAELVTNELKKRFGLGEIVLYTRFIRHVAYQTLLNTNNTEEAFNYKKHSKKIPEEEEKKQFSNYIKKVHRGRRRPVSIKRAFKELLEPKK